jgi:hypothetical protein
MSQQLPQSALTAAKEIPVLHDDSTKAPFANALSAGENASEDAAKAFDIAYDATNAAKETLNKNVHAYTAKLSLQNVGKVKEHALEQQLAQTHTTAPSQQQNNTPDPD